MLPKTPHCQRGFTLIEVLVTLFLISTAFAAYGTMVHTAILTRGAHYQETALRVAEHKLEEMRVAPYESWADEASFVDNQLDALPSGTASVDVEEYAEGIKSAIITIVWQTRGSEQTLSFTTLKAEGGE